MRSLFHSSWRHFNPRFHGTWPGRRVAYAPQSLAQRSLTSASSASSSSSQVRGWRRYANRLRNQPTSHVLAFALLHEITAIVPLVGLYWLLSTASWQLPMPERYYEEAMTRAERILQRYGWGGASPVQGAGSEETVSSSWTPNPTVVLHLATAYGITKLLLPVRLLLCTVLTPITARVVIHPLGQHGQALARKLFRVPASGPTK
ncbi:hypothetical protein H4R34_002682 [Dimargaris verticillata]|uniref:Uncharacterized protein n=1 Tax=Dimargaris verticillata TaxID=2761393 RepID=A0A9W8B7N9_9FUNG|nr:hypothetical protein H4R34_002682 [Dimargaris verticillata]